MSADLIGEFNIEVASWPIGAGLQTSGFVVTNSREIVVYRAKTLSEARRWADQAKVGTYDG